MSSYDVQIVPVTTAAGSGSGNTIAVHNRLMAVELLAVATGTIQDVAILNPNGTTIWNNSAKGTMYWATPELPVFGINTVQLTNASSNGANTVRLYLKG